MIIVTNNNDSGAGSLRQAIIDAAIGEEITFAITGSIIMNAGVMTIAKNLIITGPGSADLTINANGTSRIFNITVGVVSISGLSLTDGSDTTGGAIANDGTLTLDDIVISVCFAGADGGGIWNDSTVIATDLSIINCSSDLLGGGIWNGGSFTWNGGESTSNSSATFGGAIYNTGTLAATRVNIFANTAATSGGCAYNEGTISFTECGIYENIASGGSGMAVFNVLGTATFISCAITDHVQAFSNAITNSSGTVTVANSTVSTNTTGVDNVGGTVELTNATITLNGVGVATDVAGVVVPIYNTILAGSTIDYQGGTASAASSGHNILGVNTNPITPSAGDQSILTFAGLLLGPLQNNGGPTVTHALLTGSPALDSGDNTGAPTFDQRGTGFDRVVDGTIDIGAYESEAEPPDPPEPPAPPPEPPTPTPPPVDPPVNPASVRTCPNPPSPCPRPEEPVINTSSEAPDTVDYFSGNVFAFGDWDPPLGTPFFTAQGCAVTCIRTTQAEADACASQLALSCQEDNNPVPDQDQVFPTGGPGTPMPPIGPTIDVHSKPIFPNQRVQASAACPNGYVNVYTIEAGFYYGLSQQEATARAQAVADQRAVQTRWCVTPISGLFCLNQPITGSFRVSGFNPQIPIQFYPISLISGAYPTGVQFNQFTPGIWTATGTPTVAGEFTFTVRITNGDGSTRDTTMTMEIWSVTTTTLPDPVVGTPYSQQLTASGTPDSDVWTVTSGTLPDGLSLSTSGLISGTPTTEGAFLFIIECDRSGSSCSQQFTVEVASACAVATGMEWTFTNDPGGGTITENSATDGVVHQIIDGDSVQVGADGNNVNFMSDPFTAYLRVEWTSDGGSDIDTGWIIQVFGPGVFEGHLGWDATFPSPGVITYIQLDFTVAASDNIDFVVQSYSTTGFSQDLSAEIMCSYCPFDDLEYTFINNPNLGVIVANTASGGLIHQRLEGNGPSCSADGQLFYVGPGLNMNLRITWSRAGTAFFTISLVAPNVLVAFTSGDINLPTPGTYNFPFTVDPAATVDAITVDVDSSSTGPGEFIDVTVELTCVD